MSAGERRASGSPGQRAALGLVFLLVVLSLAVTSTLVVYTAWLHDLKNGAFALLFAVFSAKIALNWLIWRDEVISAERQIQRNSV